MMMGKVFSVGANLLLLLLLTAGGRPSKGTSADKRLKGNKPKGGKTPVMPIKKAGK